MKYDIFAMRLAVRQHELVLNRVAMVNQIHGCMYDYSADNPCVATCVSGVWQVRYCGALVCSYDLRDYDSVLSAYVVIDCYVDCLWHARVGGYLSCGDVL